jgi:WD40 repeat protein
MGRMIPQPKRRSVVGATALLAALPIAACGGDPSSPPAARPLVVSDRGGALRIYEIDAGLGVARLVGAPNASDAAWRDTMPARLPDGRVAFVSDRGGRPAIHLAGPDLTAAAALTMAESATATSSDSDPAPCGRERLVFARATAPGAPRDLWVVGLDGRGIRALTRNAADDGAPCAFGDGRTIVFVSDRDGARRLYRLDGDAPDPESTVTALLPDEISAAAGGTLADDAPACLPDGSIVFARTARGLPSQLVALGPAGASAAVRQITDAIILPRGAGEPVALGDGTLLMTAALSAAREGRTRVLPGVYRISGGGYNLARVTREGAGYSDFTRGLDARR